MEGLFRLVLRVAKSKLYKFDLEVEDGFFLRCYVMIIG